VDVTPGKSYWLNYGGSTTKFKITAVDHQNGERIITVNNYGFITDSFTYAEFVARIIGIDSGPPTGTMPIL